MHMDFKKAEHKMNSIARRGLSKKERIWFISIMKNKIIANCQCVQVDWDHFMYPLTDIWFIGDSLISHLSDRAAFRSSSNLGLANKKVHWLGTSSMHWRDLIPKFQLAMMFNPPPVMILVHVGGNDETRQVDKEHQKRSAISCLSLLHS